MDEPCMRGGTGLKAREKRGREKKKTTIPKVGPKSFSPTMTPRSRRGWGWGEEDGKVNGERACVGGGGGGGNVDVPYAELLRTSSASKVSTSDAAPQAHRSGRDHGTQ